MVLCIALANVAVSQGWLQAVAPGQEADPPRFEVTSVKRNTRNDGRIWNQKQGTRHISGGYTLADMIRGAYQLQEFQIVGGPKWLATDRFDIVAIEEADAARASSARAQTPDRGQLMTRALLADRFNLAVHKETREMPVYALVLARNDGRLGQRIRRSTVDCAALSKAGERVGMISPPGETMPLDACGSSIGPGFIFANGRTMGQIATAFSRLTNTGWWLNRLVVDRTGLDGAFDIGLRFTPDRIPNVEAVPGLPPMPAIDPDGPSIFTAVQEQLGLKLDAQRGPVEVLVIDRAEPPTED